MEKRKIDMSKYADMHKEEVIRGADGTEVKVRNHISFEEKEEMAKELAQLTVMIHDDSCIYFGSVYDKIEMYMIAKYYTDIDTEDVDYNDVADYLINNDMIKEIEKLIRDDFEYVVMMHRYIYDAIETTYRDDRSITKALRTSFGFLFNGEDVSESLAKAEAMKDSIYEAVGALRKVEKEKEENIDNGTLMIGGNIINFAKKKE